jgi:hypothetical protein
VIPVRDVALVAGLTQRLTRLVVSDDLGQIWLKDPVDRWLEAREDSGRAHPLRRYSEGLDCPHCVSFHAAYLSLGSYLLARRHPVTLAAWRFAAGTMSLSAVVGHISARID